MFLGQLFLCKIQIISGRSSISVAVTANFTYANLTAFCCERQVNIKLCLVSQLLSWTSRSQGCIHTTFGPDFPTERLLPAALCVLQTLVSILVCKSNVIQGSCLNTLGTRTQRPSYQRQTLLSCLLEFVCLYITELNWRGVQSIKSLRTAASISP